MTNSDAEPLMVLTKKIAEARASLKDMTNVTSTPQVEMYLAFQMGADQYGLDYLKPVVSDDQQIMMAVQHLRSDQVVEMAKAIQIPPGIDTGLGTEERRRRR